GCGFESSAAAVVSWSCDGSFRGSRVTRFFVGVSPLGWPLLCLRGFPVAIVWRSYNNRARMGIDASVSGSGNSRTVTATYWIQMVSSASTRSSSTVTLSGDITGNLNQTITLGPGQSKNLGSKSQSFSLTDSPQSVVLGVSATHFGGGAPMKTTGYSPALSVTLPAKVPSAPYGVTIT